MQQTTKKKATKRKTYTQLLCINIKENSPNSFQKVGHSQNILAYLFWSQFQFWKPLKEHHWTLPGPGWDFVFFLNVGSGSLYSRTGKTDVCCHDVSWDFRIFKNVMSSDTALAVPKEIIICRCVDKGKKFSKHNDQKRTGDKDQDGRVIPGVFTLALCGIVTGRT